MSTPASEGFTLLEAARQDAVGTQIRTRPIGPPSLNVLLGLDANNERHLLIPSNGEHVPTDHTSQGVELYPRPLRVDDRDVTFLDLHCKLPSLNMVFERLVDDVLAATQNSAASPIGSCVAVLDNWRSLLRRAVGTSREVILGLVGELEVLARLVDRSATAALETWTGPTGSIHDFNGSFGAIEVKTITHTDGEFVHISSLDQLDPKAVDALHLIVCRAQEHDSAPSLDERIEALVRKGLPRGALIEKVAEAGYVFESAPTINTRYQIHAIQTWSVGAEFPGLRRSDLSVDQLRGVSGVSYRLAIAALPGPLSADEFFPSVDFSIGDLQQ